MLLQPKGIGGYFHVILPSLLCHYSAMSHTEACISHWQPLSDGQLLAEVRMV